MNASRCITVLACALLFTQASRAAEKEKDEASSSPAGFQPSGSPHSSKTPADPANKEDEKVITLATLEAEEADFKRTKGEEFLSLLGPKDSPLGGKKLDEWIAEMDGADVVKSMEAIEWAVLTAGMQHDPAAIVKVNKALIRVRNDKTRSFYLRMAACIWEKIDLLETDIPDLFLFLKLTADPRYDWNDLRTLAVDRLRRLRKFYPDKVKAEEAKYQDSDLGVVKMSQPVLKQLDE